MNGDEEKEVGDCHGEGGDKNKEEDREKQR